MKKLTNIILSLALVLTLVCAGATNYQAAGNGKATFVNGYDWTAEATNQVYVYASADATASISSITGQEAKTYDWWWTVVLEGSNGVYTVTKSDFATTTGAISETLGEGKIIMMAHDSNVKNKASFDWLKALTVGEKLKMDAAWSDLAALEAVAQDVNFQEATAADESTPSTPSTPSTGTTTTPSTGTTTTPSTGSTNNVPATGDSMPVAVMASVLLASVAIVAYGLKKRNA